MLFGYSQSEVNKIAEDVSEIRLLNYKQDLMIKLMKTEIEIEESSEFGMCAERLGAEKMKRMVLDIL